MRFFKYIVKSIHLLNITLIISLVFLIRYDVLPVLNTSIKFNVPKSPEAVIEEDKKQDVEQIPSISEFIMVAEQNLFHPDRVIPAEKTTAPPVPPPEIVLYGILITDNESYAYLEDKKAPYNTPGRGRRQLVLKKGSVISGYTLTDIDDNKIELVKGENKMTVNLIDSGKPKTRETQDSSKVLTGIKSAANIRKPAFPSTAEKPEVTNSMPMQVLPSTSGTEPVADDAVTINAAAPDPAAPYISPRTRTRMMQMGRNN